MNTHQKNILICSLYWEEKTLTADIQLASTSNCIQHQIDRIEIINHQLAQAATEISPINSGRHKSMYVGLEHARLFLENMI